ncbi:dihydrodipicolinate synthase family protein (plasmid) [Rhizobium sullae]|uniref:Dihydrodipicolinate synthase family protein n=1 Tax=Rhizobium sullae TaxID=50338 RepID=A0A2N0D9D7_RHISU|nr:dihydrodipicolinate synthase family protein [Rhizobium sullae]PKA42721.1 dihydrodipicolinate synthase family protein [Rhizobium sullae]UWU18110.1 dihydrodipicolinate synthase family protein [Rhizobium sullae]
MTENLRTALTGISGILVTPYNKAGEIDTARQKPIVDKAIAAGVHILVANGNTGEFYALTVEEAQAMVCASAEHVGGRVPLLAGVGRGVRDACRLARTSKAAGAAALMVHQPPDPFSSPRGLVDYVKAIADAAEGLPVVLYLRNDAVGTKAITALCELPSVVGVKWATPNPLKLGEAIAATDPDIVWVGGLAEVWAPAFYAVGARGFTSGLINVWPERSVAIHAALEAEDYRRANDLITGMKAFEEIRAEELNGTNVTGVKAALAAIGHDCGATRPPSAWPLTPSQHAALQAFITSNEIRF